MARFWTSPFEEFERAFDQLFEELLIDRWRTAGRRLGRERAIVIDCGSRYEVQISTAGLAHQQLGLDIDDHHLTVRAPNAGGGNWERSFTFKDAIDRDAVTTHWSDHVLFVVLLKRKKRSLTARKTKET